MLLSIIIPTKNRYNSLKGCILELIKIESNEIEIIIQDNTFDNQEILYFLKKIQDHRIKYFHSQDKLSQTENSDLACGNATGNYVCYIGDDDCVANIIVDVVKYLKTNKIEACLCNMASYYWSDCIPNESKTPVLKFQKEKPWIEKIDIKQKLLELYSWGGLDIKYMPRVYHAILSRTILQNIYNKCGTFFPGAVPDMANAICSAHEVSNCIYIHLPIVISGYSYNSGAGMGARGDFVAKLDSKKTIETYHLSKETIENWYYKIPRIVDGYSLWTQSVIDALVALDLEDDIQNINFNALYAKSILKYKNMMYLFFVFKNRNVYRTAVEVIRYIIRYYKDKRVQKKQIYYKNNENITLNDACNIVNNYINENDDNIFKI